MSHKTAALVGTFAEAMKRKLREAETKYGWHDDPWLNDDWENAWRNELLKHLFKGDLVDIANYCAFGHHHGWRL